MSRSVRGKARAPPSPSSAFPNAMLSQPPSVPRGRGAPDHTIREKVKYFQQLPLTLCPASPPPLEHPLMTEEEALHKSRARIERMAERLATLPLYQARHLINLASTQLKGPFRPGCKYWGMTPPVGIGPMDDCPVDAVHPPHQQQSVSDFSHQAPEHLVPLLVPLRRTSTSVAPSACPSTPPSAFHVDVKLIPAKTSAGRPLVPVDYDPPSPDRSPTPTPSMPPPSRIGSQVISGSRPPETPVSVSQRTFIHNLQQASARTSASQHRRSARQVSPRGLKILSKGQPSKHAVSVRRPRSRGSTASRGSSPLVQVSKVALKGSQMPPRPPQGTLSQRESSEEYYNSQFNFDRQFQDITRFMEDDLAN
ncbi:hypothetical protein CTheo_7791 [Ceratobasidium theobromae]|uniref:Uncharacterized protein n=1 Tax=Ceratobasidium theobromae TaxID=1582974 RepID=A0A5N5QB83_9AGAM|nr:hypothetical protein CTheo_7791 [Ceratobasidium theobromae]